MNLLSSGLKPTVSCLSKGIRWGSNPYLLLHRQACRNRYTTDTMNTDTQSRCGFSSFQALQAEGEGVEPSRLLSSTGFQPAPVANRVALPYFHQQLDQDSNPEHLVRSEG